MIQGKPAVIIACEFSGRVREAFANNSCIAFSIDLLPTESPLNKNGNAHHFQGDAIALTSELMRNNCRIDAVIAFPPCTYLCCAGAKHWEGKQQEQLDAIAFFSYFLSLPIPYAIENPVGIMSTVARKPDQIIHPYWFGHGETKKTCLWLNELPYLSPTELMNGREAKIHRMSPGPDRSKNRSRTFQGVADAMGKQWGDFLKKKLCPPPGPHKIDDLAGEGYCRECGLFLHVDEIDSHLCPEGEEKCE